MLDFGRILRSIFHFAFHLYSTTQTNQTRLRNESRSSHPVWTWVCECVCGPVTASVWEAVEFSFLLLSRPFNRLWSPHMYLVILTDDDVVTGSSSTSNCYSSKKKQLLLLQLLQKIQQSDIKIYNKSFFCSDYSCGSYFLLIILLNSN